MNPARPYRSVKLRAPANVHGDWYYESAIMGADDMVVKQSTCPHTAPMMQKEATRLNDVYEAGYNAGRDSVDTV